VNSAEMSSRSGQRIQSSERHAGIIGSYALVIALHMTD
jgi:hypothetical protein